MDVAANLNALEAAVTKLDRDTLAVAPEGSLSGYEPSLDLVSKLDVRATEDAVRFARQLSARTGVHLVVGACLFVDGTWRNSSFYVSPTGELRRYDKINLAQSERGSFTAGDELPVFDICIGGLALRLGVQMCREIRYPEQWRLLAMTGAHVIAYVNNAVGSDNGYDVWRAHVISRAAETQRFVIGANNAAVDQKCPSLIVTPIGAVAAEVDIGVSGSAQAELDLGTVSDWVLSQARDDVISVRFA